MGLRPALKKLFDRIVYRYAFLNRVLRNVNKKLAGITSFRLRPFGIMTVRFQSGIVFRMATNETSSVTKLLFWKGPDNYEYTRIFEHLSERCTSFLDIGANTGYYSLLAAVKNGAICVYAFEPASAPFHYLEKNIKINALTNVKVYPVALSDRRGEIEFFEVDNPADYHNKFSLAGTGTLKGEDLANQRVVSRKVQTITLDDWVETEKPDSVDLIKIDTEGTEHLILGGAAKLLRRHEPILICETLFNVIEEELEKIMRGYDYRFFNYRDGRLYETSTLIRKVDNGVRDCFFVPAKKVSFIEPFIDRHLDPPEL